MRGFWVRLRRSSECSTITRWVRSSSACLIQPFDRDKTWFAFVTVLPPTTPTLITLVLLGMSHLSAHPSISHHSTTLFLVQGRAPFLIESFIISLQQWVAHIKISHCQYKFAIFAKNLIPLLCQFFHPRFMSRIGQA